MAPRFGLQFAVARGAFAETMTAIAEPMAHAGTAAIRKIGEEVKTKARASIAAAGFSLRWQQALRVDVYPVRGESLDAAAHIYHRIPYAGVFERGASIPGRPLLWLPLSQTPTRGGGRRLTPAQYIASIGPLHTIHRPGKPPLLAGLINDGRTVGGRVTPSRLRDGHRAKAGQARSIPLFVGVRQVDIRARFGVMGIVEDARSNLARYFIDNLRG